MKTQICFKFGGANPYPGAQSAALIQLDQTGVDCFNVTYGLQVERGLTYARAAASLGQAIMHNAACDGMLDNRIKGERDYENA